MDSFIEYDRNRKAVAYVFGGPLRPQIAGMVFFHDVLGGTLVTAQISGLPEYQPGTTTKSPVGPHGFHIHERGTCQVGDPNNPFLAAGEHWDMHNQPHGNHTGDFPVLFSNSGKAYMSFFTNKFRIDEAVGKTVIIHENPDDYRTQPAGNSGKRLACGIIEWV